MFLSSQTNGFQYFSGYSKQLFCQMTIGFFWSIVLLFSIAYQSREEIELEINLSNLQRDAIE